MSILTIEREKVERLKHHISLWKNEYTIALTLSGNVADSKKIGKWANFWKTLIHMQWHYNYGYTRSQADEIRTLKVLAGWRDKEAFAKVDLKWEDYRDRIAKEALPELIEMCLQLAYKIEEGNSQSWNYVTQGNPRTYTTQEDRDNRPPNRESEAEQ